MTAANIITIASLVALVVVASMHVRYKATHKWTDEDLARERKSTLKRSAASRAGLSVEHLVTLDEEFTFNGRDAQHLGSPVDFIVFDGLDEGELREIIFVEVKSGKRPQLHPRERQVRDAVTAGRVRYHIHHKQIVQPAAPAELAPEPLIGGAPPASVRRSGGLEIVELPRRSRRRSARASRSSSQ